MTERRSLIRTRGRRLDNPSLGCGEIRCRSGWDEGEAVPLFQRAWFVGAEVASVAVQGPVTTVDVQRPAAPLAVRGKRIGGVDARDGAGRLVRWAGSAVLAHALDGLRRRS
ncbi:hypothetical protein AQJ43_30170 [Streptomyces avermitilis]|uniref:Uncharacterized protein n=1 Tax=Streptomyces avermitilis TaxID=33903 RepID=A0A4D4N690_STRAX|nr:hypothetical protein AQJ43_30170 [Streptomyces avermitilis]MYS96144.1 hypothetical protein [Streptomyces sp. SID5469]BBJ47968.1 hypothetical protein SAVMC3_05970 [Streptomyces avermitilis]GDY69669.1 hypothetical protein SAV14893_090620 [Streptomyces avermitilis]GDY79923.1 hypothetical protein SAV31267_094080 [Streptomyces avermitilis]